jgi:hypothetical protein
MQKLTINADRRRVEATLGEALSQPGGDASRLSFLGAKAAGVAQRMRRSLIGDADTASRLMDAGQVTDPVAVLAANLESAHLQLAMAGSSAAIRLSDGHAAQDSVDRYCESLSMLNELHNRGVDLHASLSDPARRQIGELLEPLHDELTHAAKLFKKRVLGVF